MLVFAGESLKPKNYLPARVLRTEKGSYNICCKDGILKATLSGKLRYSSQNSSDLPSVGDWVSIKKVPEMKKAVIYSIFPRKSEFSRKTPISGGRRLGKIGSKETIIGGRTEKQVIVANIDVLFYIIGLDKDINLRLIERIITSCWDFGTTLVLVLNKSDLYEKKEIHRIVKKINEVSFDTPIHIISAKNHQGFEALNGYLGKGVTISLIGDSGVGKSTLINHLLGTEQLQTTEVRNKDRKGRHTTTWRELLLLPNGGIIIDNPGIREIQIWTTKEDVSRTFEDIEELAMSCKFKNCTHQKEPGCAILKALKKNRLDEKRYENYIKLHNEILYLLSRKKGLSKKESLKSKIEIKKRNIRK